MGDVDYQDYYTDTADDLDELGVPTVLTPHHCWKDARIKDLVEERDNKELEEANEYYKELEEANERDLLRALLSRADSVMRADYTYYPASPLRREIERALAGEVDGER